MEKKRIEVGMIDYGFMGKSPGKCFQPLNGKSWPKTLKFQIIDNLAPDVAVTHKACTIIVAKKSADLTWWRSVVVCLQFLRKKGSTRLHLGQTSS